MTDKEKLAASTEEIEYLPVDTENAESDGTFDDESDPRRKELAELQRHNDAERGIIGHRPDDDAHAHQPESE